MPKCVFDETNRPGQIELLTEGEYEVLINECNETTSNSGNPMFELVCSVPGHTARLWDYITFTATSIWKVRQVLEATGRRVPEKPNVAYDIKPVHFIGKRARARVFIDEYNGKKKPKIAEWLLPDVMDEQGEASQAAKPATAPGAAPATAPATAPAQYARPAAPAKSATPPPPPANEDELPF